ncbi:hypothetical protein ACQ4LE_010208 [Meloidogyne hapla]|uniref:Uncharacterized protein n=1 Tax=Meloidogyne hapla TaxID=6305 RepID=A0A1I8BFL1_MELHA
MFFKINIFLLFLLFQTSLTFIPCTPKNEECDGDTLCCGGLTCKTWNTDGSSHCKPGVCVAKGGNCLTKENNCCFGLICSSKQQTCDKCIKEGSVCGGIANFKCCERLTCEGNKMYGQFYGHCKKPIKKE